MAMLWSGKFEFFVPEKNRKQNVQRIKARNFFFIATLFDESKKKITAYTL